MIIIVPINVNTAAYRKRDDFLKSFAFRMRIPILLAFLPLAGLACSLTDIFNSPSYRSKYR